MSKHANGTAESNAAPFTAKQTGEEENKCLLMVCNVAEQNKDEVECKPVKTVKSGDTHCVMFGKLSW